MKIDPAANQLIRKTNIFASLSDDDFEKIIATSRIVTVSSGETLFLEGSPSEAFYIVLEGWVTLSRNHANGDYTVIDVFGPGESFAEVLLLPGMTYPASAEAASDARLARIETAQFRQLLLANAELALKIISTNFMKLRGLINQISEMKAWSTRRRVAGYLLELSRSQPGSKSFDLPIEQQVIAAHLAITPSTFSRTLGALQAVGVVARRGRIHIEDESRLAQFVDSGDDEIPDVDFNGGTHLCLD